VIEADPLGNPRFGILVVCTGNICRSPAAERLLAHLLEPSIQIGSAGTCAQPGQPMVPPMVALVSAAGADPNGFAARMIEPRLVRAADLVLTMTREHRAAAVEVWPGAVRHSFTLLEFARLLLAVSSAALSQATPVGRLQAAVPLVAARRSRLNQGADADDIADPYQRSAADYAQSFSQIQAAVDVIVRLLGGPAASGRLTGMA
jgi:protein-tyrosine phosphatase